MALGRVSAVNGLPATGDSTPVVLTLAAAIEFEVYPAPYRKRPLGWMLREGRVIPRVNGLPATGVNPPVYPSIANAETPTTAVGLGVW